MYRGKRVSQVPYGRKYLVRVFEGTRLACGCDAPLANRLQAVDRGLLAVSMMRTIDQSFTRKATVGVGGVWCTAHQFR